MLPDVQWLLHKPVECDSSSLSVFGNLAPCAMNLLWIWCVMRRAHSFLCRSCARILYVT